MACWELLYSACFTPGFPVYGEFVLLYSPTPCLNYFLSHS